MSAVYYELVMPIVVLMLLMLFVLTMRYFSYRERMALIRQGFVPPDLFSVPRSRAAVGLMRAGVITTASSFCLLIGLWVSLGSGAWLIGGFMPLGVGLGLMLSAWFSHQNETKDEPLEEPLPDKAAKEV